MTRFFQRIWRWLGRLVTPLPPRTLRPLPYARLTLPEWQAAAERVAYVQSLLADPMFRELLGMLANVRPAAPSGVDATSAAILLGQRIGHDQIVATLLAAAQQSAAPPEPLEADYGAEAAVAAWEREGTA